MRVTGLAAALLVATTLVDANPLFGRLLARKEKSVTSSANRGAVKDTPSVTTTCSYALPSNTAADLHCGVYGTLTPSLVNLLYTVQNSNYEACKDTCLADSNCISFGSNATSQACMIYGKNLVRFSSLSSLRCGKIVKG